MFLKSDELLVTATFGMSPVLRLLVPFQFFNYPKSSPLYEGFFILVFDE